MKPLLPHCFLLLSPLGRWGLVFMSLAFYFSPLRFSLERLGIGSQSRVPTLILAGCLGLSARVWSQLYSTKAFPLPGLKIAFAPVPHLASILQLLKACYFFRPVWCCIWFPEPVPWSHLEHPNHPVLHWVQSPYCWREKRTLQGLLELFVLVFHGGEKSDFLFLGFSLPGLYHCPTEGVSVTREVGALAQMKYKSGQY